MIVARVFYLTYQEYILNHVEYEIYIAQDHSDE